MASHEMYTDNLYIMRKYSTLTDYIDEITTCDCFLNRAICFVSRQKQTRDDFAEIRYLGNLSIVRRSTLPPAYIFEELMGVCTDFAQKKIFVLSKNKPVVCCFDALYNNDYFYLTFQRIACLKIVLWI